MEKEPKSVLKSCVSAIGIMGGILGIITSTIAVYQFVSGKTSLPSSAVFNINIPPIHTPPIHIPIFITVFISSNSIFYNSLWTWFWWAIGGFFSGGLVLLCLCALDQSKTSGSDFFAGGFYGIFLGLLFGFLQSLLINLLHIPYGFLISIGVNIILIIIVGNVVYKMFPA